MAEQGSAGARLATRGFHADDARSAAAEKHRSPFVALEQAGRRMVDCVALEHKAAATVLCAVAIVDPRRTDDDDAGIYRDRRTESDACDRRVRSQLWREANGEQLLCSEIEDPCRA